MLTSDKEIVTCDYCGIPQERANAEKYMAQLRTEVFGWIKTMIPTGVQSASQGDPIARSQLFEHVVRPRVEEELNSMNMQLIKLGSGVLFPPLFTSTAKLESEIPSDSKSFLADSARFQGLLPLPQTEDQISFMNDAVATTEALGYISNAARQLSEPTGRSFKTIAKNFQSAFESLSNSEPKKAGAKRMEGLALLSLGINSILEGDATDASLKLQEAVERFKVALTEIIGALGLASWYPSIKSYNASKNMSNRSRQRGRESEEYYRLPSRLTPPLSRKSVGLSVMLSKPGLAPFQSTLWVVTGTCGLLVGLQT
jgi:hypothetical protein